MNLESVCEGLRTCVFNCWVCLHLLGVSSTVGRKSRITSHVSPAACCAQVIKILLLQRVTLKDHPELVLLLEGDEALAALLKLPKEEILVRCVGRLC